jgi:hypothetical protein
MDLKRSREFLQDDNGALSSTRLIMLLWVLGVLGVWAAATIVGLAGKGVCAAGGKCPLLAAIPGSVITLTGIILGGKVLQKWPEVKASGQSNTETEADKKADKRD